MARQRNIPEKYKHAKVIYSFSRLESYHNCGYGYHLNYNLRKKGKPNIYSVLGGRTHSILEDMQIAKINKEEGLSTFRSGLFEATQIMGYKFGSEKIQSNFCNSVENYIMNYEPIKAKSVLMEKEFYTEIGGVVLVGYIDVVALNEDGTVEVIDYKTSTKYGKDDLKKHGRQLVTYAIALEQEFGVKVNKVKWDMLKYATVTFQGATKERQMFILRAELVKKLRSELKKDLRKLGQSEVEIEILLDKAEQTNDMALLPKSVQEKYTIDKGYVEYELTEEVRQELVTFVSDTVKEIESKNATNDNEWEAKNVGSFFCGNLCDHKGNCKYYKEFLETSGISKFSSDTGGTSTSTTINISAIDDEMKKLFG